MGRDVLGPVRTYQDRRVALRWRSAGEYTRANPLSGDTPCTAEQSIAGGPAPKIFVNSAMIAKAGGLRVISVGGAKHDLS